MKFSTFLIISALTACLVSSLIGWSMATGILVIPLVAIPLGVIVILSSRQHVTEVLGDERVTRIHSMAALRTLEICIILGAIASTILYSFVISDQLSPTITGRYLTNETGTKSMVLTMYKPGAVQTPENIMKTTIIPDVNSMDEYEATDFCQYRRESFQENEQKGYVGITLGVSLVLMIAVFGAFNFFYSRRY